jgi:hypothetical protein
MPNTGLWRLGALASLPNGFGILTIPKYMIYIELARRQLFGPRARAHEGNGAVLGEA